METGLRIGEFSRRVGVSAELLRAWERRYGLLRPARSSGGYRLYTDGDAERVARMQRGLDSGLSAAQAAAAALAEHVPATSLLDHSAGRLAEALRAFDEGTANVVLDELLAAFSLESVLHDAILPTLRGIGDDWEARTLDVGQEHFASQLLRGRLLAIARYGGRGAGPLALLACAPGEEHDLSLVAFGLLLRARGWRTVFLGANTPLSTLAQAAGKTRPALTVVCAFDGALLEASREAIGHLAQVTPLMIGGPGVDDALAKRIGVSRLPDDILAAADGLAA